MALSNYKFVVVDGDTVKSFNTTTRRWYTVCSFANLTNTKIISDGFSYETLSTSYDYYLLNYTAIETLEDETIVYQSESINKTEQPINSFESVTISDVEYLKCNVNAFLPKDLLPEGYKLYSTNINNEVRYPEIINMTVSATETHDEQILVYFDSVYNYDQELIYYVEVNDKKISDWSKPYKPYERMCAAILPNSLQLGENSISIYIRNANNDTLTCEETLTNCITKVNESPNIVIVSSNSDSFKVEFSINDADNDSISYRLLLNNSKYTDLVLRDWSEYKTGPVNSIYFIDTKNVVIGEENVIKIEYKDKHDVSQSYEYKFIGGYQNLTFLDSDDQYLTTDKGIIIKSLNFGSLMAGLDSDIIPVKIKNHNSKNISNLKLSVEYLNDNRGIDILLSKNITPFGNVDKLDYGNEVILPDGEKTFYIKAAANISSEGMCLFNINAEAIVE